MDPGPEPSPEVDFAEMERQIQALMGGDAPTEAATPAVDVRAEALEAEPIDPLIREIDAALSDDADALLRNSNGDIGGALRSVFDERALSGQEEEINRALIEAFGTSRVERPSFSQPSVTNPLPGFEGAARPLSPDIPREERDREVTPTPTEAIETPVVADAPAPIAPAAEPVAHAEPAPTAAPAEPITPEPAPSHATAPTPLVEPKPDARHTNGSLMQVLLLPLRTLAFPMRALPAQAHAIVTIAAITLLLWAPVAWWLAQRAVKTPLVGPVHIVPAPVVASAAETPAAAAAPASGH